MRKYLFLLSAASLIAAPAFAQDAAETITTADRRADDGQITVTATGSRTEVEDTGQAVTIITRDEIEKVQGADLARVLERVPSLTLTRNGGVGTLTSVRLRGADSEQLLVLIDGVRVADPASPSGGFDFGNLLSGNIAKLDLLRGSNSTIWGSDAVGGVLIVDTVPQTPIVASVEYGARDTASATISGDVANDKGAIGVSGSYFRTDGFSAAANGTEDDGFEQWSVAGRARAYLTDNFDVFARGRYAEGELEFDGGFPLGDANNLQETTQYSAALGAVFDNALLDLTATYSFADTERETFDLDAGNEPNFVSDGHSDRIDLRGEWRPLGPLIVNFGGEHEWSNFETNFTDRQSTRIFGAYAQLGIELGGLSGHIGARHDDQRAFGGATSFGADISYEIVPDIRIRASVGEGFKAPSLFQLFSDFGNGELQPENSTSYDLGIAWNDRSAPFYAGLTAYRRDARDQIEFVSCFDNPLAACTDPDNPRPFGTYDNVGQVRSQGIEVELGARPSDTVQIRAVYAYLDAENRTDGAANRGNVLARRPDHALTFSADWQVWSGGLTLGGDVRMVGDSFDDARNFRRLDGYAVGTVRASLPLGERLELFGRAENVTDAQYQTASGYATAGRGAFIGARTKF